MGASCRRWNVGESILPEGGSGETKSPQHTVELMVLLVFPDSHRPAHTVNILNKFLIERKTYEHFVLWVGRKSLPCRGQ